MEPESPGRLAVDRGVKIRQVAARRLGDCKVKRHRRKVYPGARLTDARGPRRKSRLRQVEERSPKASDEIVWIVRRRFSEGESVPAVRSGPPRKRSKPRAGTFAVMRVGYGSWRGPKCVRLAGAGCIRRDSKSCTSESATMPVQLKVELRGDHHCFSWLKSPSKTKASESLPSTSTWKQTRNLAHV